MKLVKRLFIWLQLYVLGVSIHDQIECLGFVVDHDTRMRMLSAIERARRELARLRSEYNALLPVGRRMVWVEA